MGSATDEKIQALGRIHNYKIRLLMNSIQMLKKETLNSKIKVKSTSVQS